MLLASLPMHQIQPVLSSSHHHHLTSSSHTLLPTSSSTTNTDTDNLTQQLYYPLATHPSYQQQSFASSGHQYHHRLSVKHEDSISNPRTATPSSLDSCSSAAETSSPYFPFKKTSSNSSTVYDSRSFTTVPIASSSMYSMKACDLFHKALKSFPMHPSCPYNEGNLVWLFSCGFYLWFDRKQPLSGHRHQIPESTQKLLLAFRQEDI
jgi:hypothetical protein